MAQALLPGEKARAADRARSVLKDGDKVRIRRADGSTSVFVFDAWLDDESDFMSRTGTTLSPTDVIAVNRSPVRFRDAEPNHQPEMG